jgi:hypothetical protein
MGTDFPPADPARVTSAERALGFKFPDLVRQVYAMSDGLEGRLAPAARYFILWTPELVVAQNEAHDEQKEGRKLVLFGSDGGDEVFAFDLEREGPPVLALPSIGIWSEDALACGRDFAEFIDRLATNNLFD